MEMTQVKYITAYLISYISEYCPGTKKDGEGNIMQSILFSFLCSSILSGAKSHLGLGEWNDRQMDSQPGRGVSAKKIQINVNLM